MNRKQTEDLLYAASMACQTIVDAIKDVSTAKKDVFPAEIYVKGHKEEKLTDFDIHRRKIDLEHCQISKEWLQQYTGDNRKKYRQKLARGLQSVTWLTNTGYPIVTFPECCLVINEALKLINATYRKTSGAMLDPGLIAERILEDPKEMRSIFSRIQFRLTNGATLLNDYDIGISEWLNVDDSSDRCYWMDTQTHFDGESDKMDDVSFYNEAKVS